jgi:hypothetical protein
MCHQQQYKHFGILLLRSYLQAHQRENLPEMALHNATERQKVGYHLQFKVINLSLISVISHSLCVDLYLAFW